MKKNAWIFAYIFLSVKMYAQSLCGTVDENENLTLTAPGSNIFISITFASYGTPDGSCGSFVLGGCHASNSASIVGAAMIGNNSATIAASNGVFGDPCSGTFKRLYVEAVYGLTLPLKLIQFTASSNETKNVLRWQTRNEDQVLHFSVERSDDAVRFASIGTVAANNTDGTHNYSFSDMRPAGGVQYYRLKMLDNDGKFFFSNVIKLSGSDRLLFSVFPNPAADFVTLHGLQGKGVIQVIHGNGKLAHQQTVTAQTETLNLQSYPPGVYLIRYHVDDAVRIQKIIRQ